MAKPRHNNSSEKIALKVCSHTNSRFFQSYVGPTFHTSCTFTSGNYTTDSCAWACRVTSISCVSYLERTNSPMEQSNARWEWFRYEVTVRDWAERSAASASGRHETDAIAGNIYSHSWMNLCWRQKHNRTVFPSTGNYWKTSRFGFIGAGQAWIRKTPRKRRVRKVFLRKNKLDGTVQKSWRISHALVVQRGIVLLVSFIWREMPFWWLSSTKV